MPRHMFVLCASVGEYSDRMEWRIALYEIEARAIDAKEALARRWAEATTPRGDEDTYDARERAAPSFPEFYAAGERCSYGADPRMWVETVEVRQ